MSGTDYEGKPGRFLRAANIDDPLNQPKWLKIFADEFRDFATQIVPS
jgi:hypothetical protein